MIIGNSMKTALRKSNIDASKISLIISLSRKDSGQVASEEKAMKEIWHDDVPPVHYVKQILGETFGASGCFAAIIGYLKGGELRQVAGQKQYVMVNSYHIGGNCFSVIIAI